MINKSVDEAVFDTILIKAFKEAFEREMTDLEKKPFPEKDLPEKYRKIERKYYNKSINQKRSVYGIIRKTVASILICLGIGFAVMMAIPTVRASVWDSVVTFYEKYMKFEFTVSYTADKIIGDYYTGYIPKGFVQTSVRESKLRNSYQYEKDDQVFVISYYNAKDNSINFDSEQGKSQAVRINNQEAYWIEYNNSTRSVVWKINDHIFVIEGNISFEEIVKIAEKIS